MKNIKQHVVKLLNRVYYSVKGVKLHLLGSELYLTN
jgi:hypothetical protein